MFVVRGCTISGRTGETENDTLQNIRGKVGGLREAVVGAVDFESEKPRVNNIAFFGGGGGPGVKTNIP